MPHQVRFAALATIMLLLTACTADAGEHKGGIAKAETWPTPGSTPQAFLNRAPLPSCGEFELEMEEPIPATAMSCVHNAIGEVGGAELIVTALTLEGDPTTTWFRALPSGGIETWSDVRRDKFAGEDVSWHYSLCPHAVSALYANGECTYEVFE